MEEKTISWKSLSDAQKKLIMEAKQDAATGEWQYPGDLPINPKLSPLEVRIYGEFHNTKFSQDANGNFPYQTPMSNRILLNQPLTEDLKRTTLAFRELKHDFAEPLTTMIKLYDQGDRRQATDTEPAGNFRILADCLDNNGNLLEGTVLWLKDGLYESVAEAIKKSGDEGAAYVKKRYFFADGDEMPIFNGNRMCTFAIQKAVGDQIGITGTQAWTAEEFEQMALRSTKEFKETKSKAAKADFYKENLLLKQKAAMADQLEKVELAADEDAIAAFLGVAVETISFV